MVTEAGWEVDELTLVGDNDCLAVMDALNSFFFNCLAIFSNSSFLKGVFGLINGVDELGFMVTSAVVS